MVPHQTETEIIISEYRTGVPIWDNTTMLNMQFLTIQWPSGTHQTYIHYPIESQKMIVNRQLTFSSPKINGKDNLMALISCPILSPDETHHHNHHYLACIQVDQTLTRDFFFSFFESG